MKKLKTLSLIGVLALTGCGDTSTNSDNSIEKESTISIDRAKMYLTDQPNVQGSVIDLQLQEKAAGSSLYLFIDTDGNKQTAEFIARLFCYTHSKITPSLGKAYNDKNMNTRRPLTHWQKQGFTLFAIEKTYE